MTFMMQNLKSSIQLELLLEKGKKSVKRLHLTLRKSCIHVQPDNFGNSDCEEVLRLVDASGRHTTTTSILLYFDSMPVPRQSTLAACQCVENPPRPLSSQWHHYTSGQGVVKVFLELSNKNCDHGSHIPEVQLGEVSRLKLRV